MCSANTDSNIRPNFDPEITAIAQYVLQGSINSELAYQTARYCLMDTLGCGMLALRFPECCKLLGPVIPGTIVPNGVSIPGTSFVLDPIQAAFNIGALVRWLDFNDTWLAAEWGHPSDNLGGILAIATYISQLRLAANQAPLTMREVLTAMIQAHEIQGVLALDNSFNRVGLDHVILVKIASTAVVTKLLGGDLDAIQRALSLAFVDGQSLRTYRHAPNAGSRKSWAAGDATARAVQLSLIAMKGEMGYPSALSAKTWGFYDVLFKGKSFSLQRSYGHYVMENILFKLSYPAEFHSQTAVECAVLLHPHIKNRLAEIDKIVLTTHESAIRIISKTGPLHNPADRDHCLQYMVAVALLTGNLTAEDYEHTAAADPRIDALRDLMVVEEDSRYSQEYLAPDKRSIANAIQVFFKDGSCSDKVAIEYPIGHKRRRDEGIPVLQHKFEAAIATRFPKSQSQRIIDACASQSQLEAMSVLDFMQLWSI